MKADRAAIQRALDAPGDAVRLYLLYGPDESGSAALAQRLAVAMGDGAERTDLAADRVAKDPGALSDAAAAMGLFGEKSWIRIAPAGEEVLPAVDALLAAPRAGNPVVVVAGALRKTSKLLARCLDAKAALCFASYPPDERDAVQLAQQMGRDRGLGLDRDLARHIVDLTGGERGLMAGEVEKLSLYHDTAPDRPAQASREAFDALSSETADQDAPALAALALSGNAAGLAADLRRYRLLGGSLAGVVRIALGKAMTVAEICGAMERGVPQGQAMKAGGRPLFRAEADEMARLVRLWTAPTIGRCIARLGAAERASRTSGAIGEVVIAQELMAITRQAARRR